MDELKEELMLVSRVMSSAVNYSTIIYGQLIILAEDQLQLLMILVPHKGALYSVGWSIMELISTLSVS